MKIQSIRLVPYLRFQGNCEEALGFYASILDGKFTIEQKYDVPEMNAPEDYRDKILHASFEFGENRFYACDIFPGAVIKESGKNVSLSLLLETQQEGDKVFDRLSEGGKVNFPFKKQFWGDWHGSFIDRFGIEWNVNAQDG
ncbi:VOC family protein [Negadavirga shengliensis]|uniref:VOC family protein n=1 Tax=Negadavirga shengliensis TaxID=1389218 RepID=A0ABV9SV06_9BACT